MSGMANGQTEPCTLGTAASSSLFAVSGWAYAGVNHSLAGNGGPECAQFVSIRRRLWETLLAVLWATALALWSWRRLQVPPAPKVVREDRGGKRCLLVLLCLVFGMELGFKFASRTVIYILNPCHIITMLQIVMLAAPPTSCLLTVLFRVHIHWLNGPLLALLFPVLNTRLLPLEQEVYWVQHGLMLAVPCYLMRLGGVFSTEPLTDLSWGLLSLALQYLYHFLVLQALALVTEVNLNSMLCPAVSDPFYGPHYRLWALAHQFLLVLVAGKLYTTVCAWLLRVTRLRICCSTGQDHEHSS
ncbi:transmembrane protein 164 isoform X1 [Dermacentor albipictus]|uniref:transmembrane protein 164 isoform X1 n=1 Tax=Dermacentor albipictus TaxID=60249 RepID=UPI0031FD16F1